jgi:hypothetical protein
MFSYFCSSSSLADSEKENRAALKVMLKERKGLLKMEAKQFKSEYKQTMEGADQKYQQSKEQARLYPHDQKKSLQEDAEKEYKRTKKQAKEALREKVSITVNAEIDAIVATEEYAKADSKTRGKVQKFREWLNGEGCKKEGGEAEEDLEVVEVFFEATNEFYGDEKKSHEKEL